MNLLEIDDCMSELEICRICKDTNEDAAFDMFGVLLENIERTAESMYDAFQKATGLHASSDDGKATSLCGSCYNRLKDLVALRRKATKSHQQIMEILNKASGSSLSRKCLICLEPDGKLLSPVKVDVSLARIYKAVIDLRLKSLKREVFLCKQCISELQEYYPLFKEQEVEPTITHITMDDTEEVLNCTENDFIPEKSVKPMGRFPKKLIWRQVFRCKHCQEAFPTLQDCREHLRNHKKHEPQHVCTICSKSFYKMENLTLHQATHVQEPQTYECPICVTVFEKFVVYLEHLPCVPENLKVPDPVSCDVCYITYSDLAQFKQHMRAIHGIRKKYQIVFKKNPYICGLCPAALGDHNSYLSHMRINHLLYACTICPEFIKDRNRFMKHMDGHKDDGRYLCRICLDYFYSVAQRKQHITLQHPDYVCKICPDYYVQGASLMTRHMLKMHPGPPEKSSLGNSLQTE